MGISFLDFFEPIKIELPDEALKFGVSEEFGQNFCLNFVFVENIDHGPWGIPSDNMAVVMILNKKKCLRWECGWVLWQMAYWAMFLE